MRNIKHVYKDYKKMLEKHQIDIISICVPTQYHFKVAYDILDFNIKGLIIEKPISYKVADANAILKKAKEKNIKVLVMYQRRYLPAYNYVKKKIEEGYIGKIELVNGFFSGSIYNIGSHFFNILQYLGIEIKWIKAELQKKRMVNDNVYSGIFGFNNHNIGSFLSNPNLSHLMFDIVIVGNSGKIVIDTNGSKIRGFKLKSSIKYEGYKEFVLDFEKDFSGIKNFTMKSAIKDLIFSLENDKEPISSAEAALRDILIIETLKTSSEQNKKINVDSLW